jgi:formamidopyrimidine-DNA glycosylase
MSADKTLVVHLGMTGFCSFFDSAISPGKHDHIVLHFSDGSVFLYNDMRRFGEVFLAHGPSDVEERVFSFAKDPFHESWSYATFFDALKKKKSPIKTVLLNQKIISGLGNIYVCEALFHSNVSPVAIAASLSEERSRMLLDAVRFVLNKAISLGGSSIVDYQHPDGGEGTFQQHLFVYSRTGKNCLRTACEGLVKRIKQAGRSSFFCSECQL